MNIQAFTKSTSLDGRGSLSIFPTESASLTLYMRCNSFDWIWIELFKLFVIWVDYVLFATHDSSCQMLQTRHWSVVAHQERGDLGRRHVLTFIKHDISLSPPTLSLTEQFWAPPRRAGAPRWPPPSPGRPWERPSKAQCDPKNGCLDEHEQLGQNRTNW